MARRTLLSLVWALAFGACGGGETRAPATDTASAPSVVATSTTSRIPDARAAWARCVGMRKLRRDQRGELAVVGACRDIFRGRCRKALATARPGLTLDEGLVIVKACAAEYCPLPRPTLLCGAPLSLADATHGMQSFVRFALSDLPGSNEYDRADIGALLGEELLPVTPIVARITITEGRVTLALDGGPSLVLPPHPTPEGLRDFAVAAKKAGADAVGLAIHGTGGLDAEVKGAIAVALLRVTILEVLYCDAVRAGSCPP